MKLLAALPILALSANAAADAKWTYEDQSDNWGKIGFCNGKTQSPISINDEDLIQPTGKDPLEASKFIETLRDQYFSAALRDIDTGHALRYNLNKEIVYKSINCYQFHLHINHGEHLFNDQTHFAEAHMVCYKNKFEDVYAAAGSNEPDALAVFGFPIDVDDNLVGDGLSMKSIIENYDLKVSDDVNVALPIPASTKKYYRYQGSLTTPDCNQVVTWTVFAEMTKISRAQMERMMKMNSLTVGNFRVPQAMNGRKVTVYGDRSMKKEQNKKCKDKYEPLIKFMCRNYEHEEM